MKSVSSWKVVFLQMSLVLSPWRKFLFCVDQLLLYNNRCKCVSVICSRLHILLSPCWTYPSLTLKKRENHMISLQNVCECFLQNVPWFLFLKNVLQILSLKKVFPDSLYKTFLIYLYKTFFDLSPWKRKRFSVTSYNVSPHFSLEIAPCTLSLKTFVSSIF